jgi:O-antigen ligase
MFILASRLPSQWLIGPSAPTLREATQEGNPVDRSIFLVLILLAIGVLVSRSFKWGAFFARNAALTAFLAFALVSVCWSDFPFIAFKRWFRDFGNYLVILVVLSDARPLEAVGTLLRRLGYLLVPLSIVLIKYFPEYGRGYDFWTGTVSNYGVTLGKNLLGLVAVLSTLSFVWDTVTRWAKRRESRTRRIILVNAAFIAMSLWLLSAANSVTCRVCLALGCLVVVGAHSNVFRRQPVFLKVLIPGSFILYLILSLGFGMSAELTAALGKDPTFNDRTKMWAYLLSMHTDPLLGTGYESFWMGPRLQSFWDNAGVGRINEAHNGYLEVYLNLGSIGLLLLIGFLIASYRTICRRLRPFSSFASLALALWTILLFFNVTEVGFRSGLMWVTFLLAGVVVPRRSENHALSAAGSDNEIARERLESTSWG